MPYKSSLIVDDGYFFKHKYVYDLGLYVDLYVFLEIGLLA